MTTEEALQFLADHSPLPDDDSLTDELIEQFDEVRKFFLENPDPRCIRPMLHSFGEGSGLGVYQLVEDVIVMFTPQEVLPHLQDALKSPHTGVRYWSLQMVPLYPDDSLLAAAVECLRDEDDGVRYAAADAVAAIGNREALGALEQALHAETDGTVRKAIEEAIETVKGE